RATSKQNGTRPNLQRPANDDKDAWKAYWKAQRQPWRTEPEINVERQKYLEERRSIKPSVQHGIYPFKDLKLSRADIEWLLAIHQKGCGPIDWSDESQRKLEGLELCGADLDHVNLKGLPLAGLVGSLDWWKVETDELIAADFDLETTCIS